MGISISKKSITLFCDFYKSDIIIASPLGLKIFLQSAQTSDDDYSSDDEDSVEEIKCHKVGKFESAERKNKEGSNDFLSSIEILIIYKADVILMQNWDHLTFVTDSLNRLPGNNNDTNFFRVR